MNRERIEKLWADGYAYGDPIDFAEIIAAIARNEALEEAAQVCELRSLNCYSNYDDDNSVNECADAIRELKKV